MKEQFLFSALLLTAVLCQSGIAAGEMQMLRSVKTLPKKNPVPVVGAKVIIELPVALNKKGSVTTDSNGIFAFAFTDADETFGKYGEKIQVKFTVIPPDGFPYQADRSVVLFDTVGKKEGSYFEYFLKFEKDSRDSLKGRFVIERNRRAAAKSSKEKGGKQGKGSAVKTGDSYQGEVMHF